MTQPQPTAALTDAELIDALIGEVRRAYYPYLSGGHEFAERIYTLGKELESRRLARAESAPGVTVPVETAKAARDGLGIAADHHARSEQARNALNRHWQILSDAIDAALADAE